MSPRKGRSTTRTRAVSLVARPSLATSARSASTAASVTTARPSVPTVSSVSRHPAPVSRQRTVTSRRPVAVTPKVTADPRASRGGASVSASAGSNVPRQAATGFINALQPSARRSHDPPASAITFANAMVEKAAVRSSRWRCAGAGVACTAASAFPIDSAARATNTPPSCATSSRPVSAPRRSRCSSSIARATACAVVRSAMRCPSRRARSAVPMIAVPQTANGTSGGSSSQRPRESHIAPAVSSATAAARGASTPATRAMREARAVSRSTRSSTLIAPLRWSPRT